MRNPLLGECLAEFAGTMVILLFGAGVCVGAGVGVAAPGTVMPTHTVSPNS